MLLPASNACRLIEVEYAEIEDRKVRSQLQNVGAIERQVSHSYTSYFVGGQLPCFAVMHFHGACYIVCYLLFHVANGITLT